MYRGKNYLTKEADGTVVIDCDLYLDTLEKMPFEDEDELLENGFEYISGDNTYNYENMTAQTRETSYTMNWVLYMKKNPTRKGFQYVVEIKKHLGWDVRCNYRTLGYYKTNENCFYYMLWLLDAYKWADLAQRYYLNDCLNRHKKYIDDYKSQF